MPEVAKSRGRIDQGPDPSPDCPRCNYFTLRPQPTGDRMYSSPYPPLDQKKVDDILTRAFPQKSR